MGYFTVEVKPTIAASKQALGAFSAKNVLFDWTSFDVPKGANKLIDVALMVRGTDGTYQEKDTVLYFAKSKDGGATAPSSIGTVHATADGTGYFDHVIGAVQIMTTDFKEGLDHVGVATLGHGGSGNHDPGIVLQGEAESGTIASDKLYLAATCGAYNFASTVQVSTETATNTTAVVVKTTDPRVVFAVGDTLHDEDDQVIGTIESIQDDANIVLESNAASVSAVNKDLYNINPVKIILCFEDGK
tara:strand:+ start:28 stop:762 length:735 start_codon:yes stop_codon:yes gene_type:complete